MFTMPVTLNFSPVKRSRDYNDRRNAVDISLRGNSIFAKAYFIKYLTERYTVTLHEYDGATSYELLLVTA